MVCDVPTCPVLVEPGSRFCALHKLARTAKELRLGPNKEGLGAASCVACGRRFKDTDFVLRETVNKKSRKTTIAAYRHVACEPTTSKLSRKQIREASKPLFDAAEINQGG
jgi:hypothetical protein